MVSILVSLLAVMVEVEVTLGAAIEVADVAIMSDSVISVIIVIVVLGAIVVVGSTTAVVDAAGAALARLLIAGL